MPKEPNKKPNANGLKAQNSNTEVEDDGCQCCHCGSAPEDLRSQTYQKMREHLQQRLKAKSDPLNSNCTSSAGSRSSSCNVDSEEVDYLVRFIEGNENITKGNAPNPKKAAKKARQKEKKLEQLRAEEVAAKQAASAAKKQSAASQNKKSQDKVPNGMVRITHNPLTNSAVITPLYGPISNPSYLQQPLNFSQPFKMTPSPSPVASDPIMPEYQPPKPSTNPTYPLASNNSTTPASQSPSNGQPMVTIRRVMQPNISEPVVTVTLKGETPGNDRVLFTLVNGHVLPSDKSSSGKEAPSQPSAAIVNQNAPAVSNAQTRKKQKKLEKRRQKKLLEAANQDIVNVRPITPPEVKLPDQPAGRYNPPQDFSLENFRLPPGITLTRIQGSHPPPHPELPVRLVDQQPRREMSMPTTNSSIGGQNPIIVTSPLSAPKTKESMATPNVIVVDTRKMQQEPVPQQQTVRVVQTCSVACQTGDDLDDEEPNPATLTKKQRKKLRRKEKLLEEQAVLNQLAKLQLESDSKKTSKKNAANQNAKATVIPSSNSKSSASDSQKTNAGESKGSKKKKKKSRTGSQSNEDKWEENVFVPKADIDLDGGDLDEDERELEAFKRFCFNSVPPERKEKVRINLNVKDIFGRKSNGLQAASCK